MMSIVLSYRKSLPLAVFGAAAMMALPTPARAGTGCNGVINPFVWYCAPWDNNNGSQFPYYRKRQITVPANQAQIVVQNGQQMAKVNGQFYPLIGNDGASLRVWAGN